VPSPRLRVVVRVRAGVGGTGVHVHSALALRGRQLFFFDGSLRLVRSDQIGQGREARDQHAQPHGSSGVAHCNCVCAITVDLVLH